ncbi:hypothetical protein [Salinivirga cyanobacteriivorans]
MEQKKRPLTEKDIMMIRSEKRMGFVFASLFLTAGAFVSLVLTLLKPDETLPLALTITLSITLSTLVVFLVNRKHNLDLKNGQKYVKAAILSHKEKTASYEAGSGKLYIPILGDLFPKLWGQKMRKSQKYYFIVGEEKHEVDEQVYKMAEPEDKIEMNYTYPGNNLLGITID